MEYEGSNMNKAIPLSNVALSQSHKHEKTSNKRKITKMEAAMHYIDFQKSNWYDSLASC